MSRPSPPAQSLPTRDAQGGERWQAPAPWGKLPAFWFILFLSYRCTRRCPYCYSFKQASDGHPQEMSEKSFARLLDWIVEVWRINRIKVNYIGFLGGEPLLRTGRIRRLLRHVREQTGGMQAALNTNADLVDSVDWDDLELIQWITTSATDLELPELARRMAIIRQRSNVKGQTIAVTLDEANLGRILDITRLGVENSYRLRYQKDIYRGLDLGLPRKGLGGLSPGLRPPGRLRPGRPGCAHHLFAGHPHSRLGAGGVALPLRQAAGGGVSRRLAGALHPGPCLQERLYLRSRSLASDPQRSIPLRPFPG